MTGFKNILVPVDFSEYSNEAVRVASALASSFGSALTLVHAHDIPSYAYYGVIVSDELISAMEEYAQKQLDDVLAALKATVPQAQAIVRRGPVIPEIMQVVEAARPDLVVMGTHGRRGLSRALLGSVAEAVVRSASSPVLTVHPLNDGAKPNTEPPSLRIRHVVAATDFGDSSAEAVDLAARLSIDLGAQLTLLHVCELPDNIHYLPSLAAAGDWSRTMEAVARHQLDGALAALQKKVPGARGEIRGGASLREILAFVEQNRPDLLVIGTHGRKGIERLWLGSVAERVVRAAPVPVLSVRGKPLATRAGAR